MTGELDGSISDDPAQFVGNRAENLYLSRKYLCSEAVLISINQSFGGELTEEQAVALSAGFSIGIAESGCLCGAISGGIMALGYFIGGTQPYRHRKEIREAAGFLHRQWLERRKSTCCRILTRNVKHDAKVHFQQCAKLTSEAAEMSARIIINKRPELAARLDIDYAISKSPLCSSRWRWFNHIIRRFV